MEDFIIEEFYEEMKKCDLSVFGILDGNCLIHTLGTDSKIIGRIFEMFTQPVLEKIAKKHKLLLKTPESQTVYPDFVLMTDEKSTQKIAIDVKTTYVKSDKSKIKFTLGSYGSYMRNGTKNIEYKYDDYAKHYVIGFVYKRKGSAQQSRVFKIDERNQIVSPYYDVKYFIQEKYKIVGEKPGSGNTENIGSISTNNFDDFVNGNGPFSKLGSDVYNAYWKFYPKYRDTSKDDYHSLREFLNWCHLNEDNAELLKYHSYEAITGLLDDYFKKRAEK